MIRTARGYINPLLWGICGWGIAVLGNGIAHYLIELFSPVQMMHGYMHLLIHSDELFVGFCIGIMRWVHGNWQIEHIHQSRQMEVRIRNALQVLYLHENPDKRREALNEVLAAFDQHRPVHPDFRLTLTEFLAKKKGHERNPDAADS